MASHFDTIAAIYNKIWYFSDSYQTSMVENIVALLELSREDALLDIGGGTGAYTRLLKDAVGLDTAWCIEPSEKMYLEACKIPSIQSIHSDAMGIMGMDLQFTKVLLKEVVHHIPDRKAVWNFLGKKLPAQGKILIVTRPQDIAIPLFEKAREAFRRNQPHHETLMDELGSCGFKAAFKLHHYSFTLDKSVWFELIRNRFMSDLAKFSHDEIEAGLCEIDKQYPQEAIEIPDTIIYITASMETQTGVGKYD